jgi:RNA polymerase sigma-70 factor (ECF subfamily)
MVLDANGQEVIEACQRGEAEAFSFLFSVYKDRVYSIAFRFSDNSSVAMDITQEVFLKLLSKIQDFRGEASFDSWLYRLVVNCCLDHKRSGRRWSPLFDGLITAIRTTGETVLQKLVRTELEQSVQSAVAKLPRDLRMVVILRYTEELSYDEIAAILECAPGTVASRLNRAHKLLQRRLHRWNAASGGTHV